jgi:hypothetical protein
MATASVWSVRAAPNPAGDAPRADDRLRVLFRTAWVPGRLDQVRDQVETELQLHVDLGERVLVGIAASDQPVVAADQPEHDSQDDDHDDDRDDDPHGEPFSSGYGSDEPIRRQVTR